ncbi:MAG TPA: tripartite tricarboxylate transporter TctB family protein [Thermodesulfobacteriota bacterium]|nr:tripartite tricarboxylate transporter TctB family protein [Thermodesulfobacteriota bacterium]
MTERSGERPPGTGGTGAGGGGRTEGLADAAAGLLLLALAGAVFWLTRDLPSARFVPLGPAFFPRAIAALLAVLAALLAARGVLALARRTAQPAAREGGGDLVAPLVVFGSLAAYIGLIPVLGFYTATFAFVTGLAWLLGERRLAELPKALALAAATTVVVYAVFTAYLHVLFPEGLLR